jgi:hypothetical protein
MSTDLKEGNSSEGGLESMRAYERPVLTPVGNLHDLLASGGTQNADPGGPSGPICGGGGVFFFPPEDC